LRPGGNVQESKGKKRMVELAEEAFGEAMHADMACCLQYQEQAQSLAHDAVVIDE
jgi:hypothetical protein